MNAQLALLFAQHKTAILTAGAAGIAGLALLRKKSAGAASTATTAGATVPTGTLPAAAVVSGSTGGAYDSTGYDVYNGLQPELQAILQNQQALQTSSSGGISSAPSPVASSLLQPSYNGNYVRFADGQVDEVQSDGSLLWLDPTQSGKAFANKGGSWVGNVDQLTYNHPATGVYNTGQNLITLAKGGSTTPAAS